MFIHTCIIHSVAIRVSVERQRAFHKFMNLLLSFQPSSLPFRVQFRFWLFKFLIEMKLLKLQISLSLSSSPKSARSFRYLIVSVSIGRKSCPAPIHCQDVGISFKFVREICLLKKHEYEKRIVTRISSINYWVQTAESCRCHTITYQWEDGWSWRRPETTEKAINVAHQFQLLQKLWVCGGFFLRSSMVYP